MTLLTHQLEALDKDCRGSGVRVARGEAVQCICGAAWKGTEIPRHQPYTHGYERPLGRRYRRIRQAEAKGLVGSHAVYVAMRPFLDEVSLSYGQWWAEEPEDKGPNKP